MKKNKYSKSPLNYIGGKYKMLPQIMKFFPKKIDTMVDLFAGGCDVCTNVSANKIYANDINYFVIDIYKTFQQMTIEDLLLYIDNTIKENNLSIMDKEAYNAFRKAYNDNNRRNPLDLYILVCFAFNHQFRFNNSHEFNSPFGKDRSCFNQNIRKNLIEFHKNIQDIEFSTMNFKQFDVTKLKAGDFLYADPPYLITTGSYNDGKRGFEGWNQKDDRILFDLLDQLDEQGVRFAFSNVSEHKG
ncbi:MAG: Dam family site-specific DNA-(adenine-N6)-methyltransferase, partial [Eubacteriales bacterium]|nr:Dam family site-specific DNA-(adenine-N6)-methyltransferase [Eubacteriales bacterium]